MDSALVKQHLIDPEICIRCNTCEATCPIGAVTHDANNYVVDPEKCNFCMDCVSPCPTGSINHFVMVERPYSLEDQLSWSELPQATAATEVGSPPVGEVDAIDDEAAALLAEAHKGVAGPARRPRSASEPRINLFNRRNPAEAVVTGNFRLTAPTAESDIRHIILDLGARPFPVLEGQSIGIVPPGTDAAGRPHAMRLYSIASPRDGERPNTNNLALTVKRVLDRAPDGSVHKGVASNYICDLNRGDRVGIIGPFGATFLMPDDPGADIVMICTGTGSAPMRAMTERRRRTSPAGPGRMFLFFGARTPQELPYFGPLKKVPASLLDQELVFSRLPDVPKEYVQDRMRKRGADLARVLARDTAHIYVCGLKGMEAGVDAAFDAICREAGLEAWSALRQRMRAEGRYHVETY